MKGAGSLSNLDLIEECLDSIYHLRRENLLSKTYYSPQTNTNDAELRQLQQIRLKKESDMVLKEKGSAQKVGLMSSVMTLSPSKLAAREGMNGSKDDFESTSLKLRKKITEKGILKSERSNSSFSSSSSYLPVHSKPVEVPSAMTSSSSSKDDASAMQTLSLFNEEMESLGKKALNKDERCEVADYLTDRFMSQSLDRLPASKTVTQIRKDVSNRIEVFVTTSNDVPEEPIKSKAIPSLSQAAKFTRKSSLSGAAISAAYTAEPLNSTPQEIIPPKAASSGGMRSPSMAQPAVVKCRSLEEKKMKIKEQCESELQKNKSTVRFADEHTSSSSSSSSPHTMALVAATSASKAATERQAQQATQDIEMTVEDIKSLLSSLSTTRTANSVSK